MSQQETQMDGVDVVEVKKPDWYNSSTWGSVKKEDFDKGGRFEDVIVHHHCMPNEIIKALYGDNADPEQAKQTVHSAFQMQIIRRFCNYYVGCSCCPQVHDRKTGMEATIAFNYSV